MVRSFVAAILSVLLLASVAEAGEYFNHNGSTMRMVWGEGDGFEIRYAQPRSGLPVSRGTVLFEGASPANGSIYGTAYIFSSKCGRIGYDVTGKFRNNGDFYLQGEAPVRNTRCRVVRYEWNSNSLLDFRSIN